MEPNLTQPDTEPSIDAKAFRSALALFASGVTVITTRDVTGSIHGMTATAFCSLSLRPPLVLVAVKHDTRCHAHVIATRRFGVSVLGSEQTHLSRHFGGDPNAQPLFETLDEVPVVAQALVQLSCHLDSSQPGGDHSIFVGRVMATRTRAGEPLIHFGGRYRYLAETQD